MYMKGNEKGVSNVTFEMLRPVSFKYTKLYSALYHKASTSHSPQINETQAFQWFRTVPTCRQLIILQPWQGRETCRNKYSLLFSLEKGEINP